MLDALNALDRSGISDVAIIVWLITLSAVIYHYTKSLPLCQLFFMKRKTDERLKAEIERIILVRDQFMKRDGLTKEGYAAKLGYKGLPAYNLVEKRGANPTYLIKLFETYGVPSDYILFGIKSPF